MHSCENGEFLKISLLLRFHNEQTCRNMYLSRYARPVFVGISMKAERKIRRYTEAKETEKSREGGRRKNHRGHKSSSFLIKGTPPGNGSNLPSSFLGLEIKKPITHKARCIDIHISIYICAQKFLIYNKTFSSHKSTCELLFAYFLRYTL